MNALDLKKFKKGGFSVGSIELVSNPRREAIKKILFKAANMSVNCKEFIKVRIEGPFDIFVVVSYSAKDNCLTAADAIQDIDNYYQCMVTTLADNMESSHAFVNSAQDDSYPTSAITNIIKFLSTENGEETIFDDVLIAQLKKILTLREKIEQGGEK